MNPHGLLSLLKEGTRHYSGVYEATVRNIQACRGLSETTRTSLGPNGMNKLIIDSRNKLFVTSDAATILKELEVVHPAAKMLVLAAERQEHEYGDGTNLVVTLCGELLQQAEALLVAGLHPSEIISGFTKAGIEVQRQLETLATHQLSDPRNALEVTKYLRATIDSKQYGYSSLLTPIIAQACIDVLPPDAKSFSVDSVRTVKILGGSIADTKLIRGFALTVGAEGTIRHIKDAKVGVFVSGIDVAHTEVKGTLRFRTAQSLEEFSRTEEQDLEQLIIQIKASGCNVVVSGQAVGELAMHFLERYGLMVLKVPSKFQLRRLCQATKARPLVRLGAPTPDEIGTAASISIDEVGSLPLCTIAVENADDSEITTILIRGSSTNIADDVERCVDDGVHSYKAMLHDPRFVPGAGATEIELAHRLHTFAESVPGLDQYAIKKYAEALEIVPRILAENSSMKSIDTISSLYAAHTAGAVAAGINVDDSTIGDALERGVFDSYIIKANAIRLATETATTILNIDQIIMSKPAGGPKIPEQGARDSLAPYS